MRVEARSDGVTQCRLGSGSEVKVTVDLSIDPSTRAVQRMQS